jgi:NADPH:quinone reductase-like Zn-dependent oxidoreductase
MKIARIYEYGGPENIVIEEAAAPVPGAGQVLVRVAAGSVNPVDWKVCAGALKAVPGFALPQVPGGDIAGRVEALGEGVAGWKPGDAVYGFIGLVGADAELVAVKAEILAAKPETLSFEEAASIPLAGLTAWQGLLKDGRDLSGLHVLVHGAAGGVGTAAVQFAKAKGARVTASASAKNAVLMRELGADVVVDFRVTPAEGLAKDVDVLLDCVADDAATALWALVKPGGSMTRVVRVASVRVAPSKAQLEEIAGLVAAGRFRPVVARVFPFAQLSEAFTLNREGRVVGKIALSMA